MLCLQSACCGYAHLLLFASRISTLQLLASFTSCRLLPAAILASDLAVAGLPVLLAQLPDTALSEAGFSAIAGVLALAAILIATGDYLFEVL